MTTMMSMRHDSAGTRGTVRRAFDGDALAQVVYRTIENVAKDIPAMLDVDYDLYKSGVRPGETVAPKGLRFRTEAARQDLREACDEAMREIDRLCDDAESVAREELVEAPDAAALSYAQALSGRAGVTADEVAAAFKRYGSNWTVFQILLGVVRDQRAAGNRDFYKIDPRNTLDNWVEKVQNIRLEARTFLDYLARQAYANEKYADSRTLSRRLDQLSLALRYVGQGVDGGRSMGGSTSPGWAVYRGGYSTRIGM